MVRSYDTSLLLSFEEMTAENFYLSESFVVFADVVATVVVTLVAVVAEVFVC